MKKSIVAACLAALAATIPLRAEIVEQVLVKVNGEIITKTEFEQRQVAELRNRPELAKAGAASLELQRAIAQVTPRWASSSSRRLSRTFASPTTSRTKPVSRRR